MMGGFGGSGPWGIMGIGNGSSRLPQREDPPRTDECHFIPLANTWVALCGYRTNIETKTRQINAVTCTACILLHFQDKAEGKNE